jgi:uncharacterized protein (DUF1330 family)
VKTANGILTTALVLAAALTMVGSQTESHAQQEDPVMPTTDSVTDDAAFAALAELPDDEPLIMLNLLEYTDTGETYAKYGRIALPQIQKRGGRILYGGTPLRDDPIAGHWDRVIIVYYPSRAAFLDMMADPAYREGLPHRTAGLKRTVLYAFTQTKDPAAPSLEPVPIQGGEEIFVLNLLRFKPDGGREDYGKDGQVVLPMVQERGGSRALILDGQLPLVSEETWEDLYLVRYPTLEALQGMVATEAWQKANEDRQRGLDLTWAFPTRP